MAAALEFDVLGAELFNRLPVVEPRGVAEIDPEADLDFVALHRVEHELRRVAELQRDLVVISVRRARRHFATVAVGPLGLSVFHAVFPHSSLNL